MDDLGEDTLMRRGANGWRTVGRAVYEEINRQQVLAPEIAPKKVGGWRRLIEIVLKVKRLIRKIIGYVAID